MSQQDNHVENILDKLYVCKVDLRIWTGQVQADDDDYQVGDNGRMPSKKVVQSGRKFIVNPDTLSGFTRIRSQVRRDFSRVGFPFLGGWAIPLERKDELDNIMQSAVEEFFILKDEFIRNYKDNVTSWIADNPDDSHIIRRGTVDSDDIIDRFDAQIKRYSIVPTTADDAVELEKEVVGLGGELLKEICEQADKIYLTNFVGKEKVSATVTKTFKGIRTKLHGLSFLNGKFVHIVKMLDKVIQGCELHRDRGMLTAPFIYEVMANLIIISDVKKLEKFVDGMISVSEIEDSIMPEPPEEVITTHVEENGILPNPGLDNFSVEEGGESSGSSNPGEAIHSSHADNQILAFF